MNLLIPYIKAGYPVIYLQTAEENRAEVTILAAATECKRKLEVWSHTDGFSIPGNTETTGTKMDDPIAALQAIKTKDPRSIFVFRDLHSFLKVAKTKRLIRDIAKSFRQTQKTLIILSPINEIPPELERDITLLEFSLPGKQDIAQTFNALYTVNKESIGIIEEDEIERIIQAAMGLTTDEAEAAFSKALVERSEAKKREEQVKPISKMVLSEKAESVRKTGILEYFEASETVNDVGGLQNLKTWLAIRSKSFSKRARDFRLPMPRGILLVGLPGCGKSLSAKVTSNILGVPLIRFDVGRIFGGLVGQSERNLRTAIQTVEAVGNCVLWIDEMCKAFAGMGGSGSTDGGTSQRVFGNFITWLQEKTAPVFVVATLNRIEGLPAELLRKGRFDEIFFVGLPSDEERGEILKIHIKKYGRDPKNFDLTPCVEASKDFSGAELEEAVVSGLYMAFHQERELITEDIVLAIKRTNPLARSKSDALMAMAKWAEKNAINASAVA